MKKFEPPRFHEVAVVGDDPHLLAELSAKLAIKGKYLAVVDGPRLQRQDAEAEVTRRNNAFARVKTKKIVMAGLPADTVDRFAGHFSRKYIFPINNLAELNPIGLGVKVRNGEPIRWGRKNIGIGLLKALNAKAPIEFVEDQDEDRHVLPVDCHLVVCEEGNEHAQVVAAKRDRITAIAPEFSGPVQACLIINSKSLCQLRHFQRNLIKDVIRFRSLFG